MSVRKLNRRAVKIAEHKNAEQKDKVLKRLHYKAVCFLKNKATQVTTAS